MYVFSGLGSSKLYQVCKFFKKNQEWILHLIEHFVGMGVYLDSSAALLGFPGGTSGKEPAWQWKGHKET